MDSDGIELKENVTSIDEKSVCGTREKKTTSNNRGPDIWYDIDAKPPWLLALFLGLQQYLTMFSGTAAMPILLAPALCISVDSVHTAEIISTLLFVSGIVTLVQTTVGVRLPIIQGGTITFLLPLLSILSLPKWSCDKLIGVSGNITTSVNGTWNNTGVTPQWHYRMREIQGAIMTAPLVQVIIGLTGAMGMLLRFIGPLTIIPTISLIGISLFTTAADISSSQWVMALITMFLIIVMSQCTDRILIPCYYYSRKDHKCDNRRLPLFKMFPVILSILLVWLLCYILTVSDALPRGESSWWYQARTDIKTDVLYQTSWFRVPYPGQWGTPTFSVEGTFGMLAGVLAGIVESVGDYYSTAKLSGAPLPPKHAINRGILIEGLGGVLAGAFGSGTGTSSFSENVGAVGITKVGSRFVIQIAGALMLVLALFGKLGAIFVTIPNPIIGGVLMTLFGMIIAVGLQNLQHVNMNNLRNMFIAGFSILFGLAVPQWLARNPGNINTGSVVFDQICVVLASSSMVIGGFTGFALDNILPGSKEDRGIAAWVCEDTTRQRTRNVTESQDVSVVGVKSRDVIVVGGNTDDEAVTDISTYDMPWSCCHRLNDPNTAAGLIPFCPASYARVRKPCCTKCNTYDLEKA